MAKLVAVSNLIFHVLTCQMSRVTFVLCPVFGPHATLLRVQLPCMHAVGKMQINCLLPGYRGQDHRILPASPASMRSRIDIVVRFKSILAMLSTPPQHTNSEREMKIMKTQNKRRYAKEEQEHMKNHADTGVASKKNNLEVRKAKPCRHEQTRTHGNGK